MIMSEPIVTPDSNTPAGMLEGDLVRRAQRGDLEAYDELVKRYQQRIYATIYHMTSNHEDANDLAQDAFIKAYSALKSFRGGSTFYTWVYRIAVNKTINFLKQRKNKHDRHSRSTLTKSTLMNFPWRQAACAPTNTPAPGVTVRICF